MLSADRGFVLRSLTDCILVQVLDRASALGSLPTIEFILVRTHDHLAIHADNLKETTLHQQFLWKISVRLGDLATAQGQLPAAERHFAAALAIRKRLADQDPANSDWQRDLSYSLTLLAELAEKQGDRPKALKLAEASLSIDERLAALDSSNVTWQKDVAVSRALVARLRG